MSGDALRGIGVGVASIVGQVRRFDSQILVPDDEKVPCGSAEVEKALEFVRFCLERVREELEAQANAQGDQVVADVVIANAEIVADPELAKRIENLVREGNGPAGAVNKAFAECEELFDSLGGYMAERKSDLRSLRDRVLAKILGKPDPVVELEEPRILVAKDLTPADTVSLDLSNVLAVVTQEGGSTSHTAIIARQNGIPCVVGVASADKLTDGALVAVESAKGLVTLAPDEKLVEHIRREKQFRRSLASDRRLGATKDGRRVELLANIGGKKDANRAVELGAEGVGLFRTEFLFLGADLEPTVSEQEAAYSAVFERFRGKKVVLRTLDAGSDKPLSFANNTDEPNPALGVRGYRLAKSNQELLLNQLVAVNQAAARNPETDVWVMAPMVSTEKESADFARLVRNLESDIKVGVMVEVPSAALCAYSILSTVDFVSLGTNDLAQYVMASDRQLASLADLLSPWQPAVLQLVSKTVLAAKAAGKPVGVCGEAASDPLLALFLVGLGASSLSMSAASIAEVRFALRNMTRSECADLAHSVLLAGNANEARACALEMTSPEALKVLGLNSK